MSQIRAVFFDVDDTLVDFDGAARTAFSAVFGASADYHAWMLLTQTWHRRFPTELTWEAMRIGRTSAFCEASGLHGDPSAIEVRRMALLEKSYARFPDVAGCLSALRGAGLRLGIITNSDLEHQRRKLAAVGLSRAFDVLVTSGEVGAAKPDRAIFDYACAALGVPAAAAVHVGDRLDLDATAAARAGLRGVWLDRCGMARGMANGMAHGMADGRSGMPDEGCEVAVLTSLDRLPALIG